MRFIKHVVNDMDESLIQHCVLCSEVIADYNNVYFAGDQPTGWAAGEVFVAEGNPKIYTTSVNERIDIVTDCMNPLRNP